MDIFEIVRSKIDRLINIQMTSGVQPEDLANNIYINDYESIAFHKENKIVVGELKFREELNGCYKVTTLRYIYDEDRNLSRIEEVLENNNIIIEWDRGIKEYELINDILVLLKSEYNDTQIQEFIKTLPCDLQRRIENELNIVA